MVLYFDKEDFYDNNNDDDVDIDIDTVGSIRVNVGSISSKKINVYWVGSERS